MTSCQCILFKLFNEDDSAVDSQQIFESENKRVVFLPMVHLGKKDYFKEAKAFVDSLRDSGYHVYHEGMYLREDITEEEKDVYLRKFRRELGFFPSDDYSDPRNKSLPRCFKKYIGQSLENTGINPETDTNIDYEITELIDKYEDDRKEIKLDECDFKTAFNEKYKCSKGVNQILYKEIRNNKIIDEILKSEHDKILLVFGKGHFYAGIDGLTKKGFELKTDISNLY